MGVIDNDNDTISLVVNQQAAEVLVVGAKATAPGVITPQLSAPFQVVADQHPGVTITIGSPGPVGPQGPSGSSGTSSLAADTDVSITGPSNGQVLTYNSGSTKWTNQAAGAASVTFLSVEKWGTD